MEVKKRQGFHYAWVIMVCGCAIVGVNLGVFAYTLGNFYLPVSLELGVGVGAISFYHTVSSFSTAFMLPTARKLLNKVDLRIVMTCATISSALAYAMMSRVTALWQVYACAVWMGFSNVFFGGITVPLMINNWFKKNSGTVYGVCLSTGAIVGIFANPFLASVIGANTWREGYLAIAAIAAVVLLPVSLFLVRMRPEDKGMTAYGAEDIVNESGEHIEPEKHGVPAEVALRSSAFFALLLGIPCLGVVFNVTNHITTYATVIGIGASTGAYLTSFSLVGGTLGKLTLGRFSDKYGTKFAITLSNTCSIVGVSMVILSTWLGSWLLFPAVLIFGYGASTTSLMGALVPKAVFGERDYDKILSYTSMAMSIGVGIISPIYGFLYDGTGSYLPSFALAIGLSAFCLASILYAIKKGNKLAKEYN